MFDIRPVFFVLGMLMVVIAAVMTIPLAVDAVNSNPDWQAFAVSSAITFFIGMSLVLANRMDDPKFSIAQAFILTAGSWLVLTLFAALPFMLCTFKLSLTDAYFEAMSGLTTTGATVITGLDTAPPGLLLWRGILHWVGGIGIIAMAIVILPMLKVGGMLIFRVESSDTSEKVMPRAAQIVVSIFLVYVGLNVLCAAGLKLLGMNWLESSVHAMSTLATGGFSTSDLSVGKFNSAGIDAWLTLFMILGALPFALYVSALAGDIRKLITDTQVRAFLSITLAAIVLMTLWVWGTSGDSLLRTLRYTSFSVVSMLTGTGFATTDFALWGGGAHILFLVLMLIGGCTGSAAGGIKVFRFQILSTIIRGQTVRLSMPHRSHTPMFNRKPIPAGVAESVVAFSALYLLIFAILTTSLALVGLDFMTALSGAATTLGNVGPGLSELIGPASTFKTLPDDAKWIFSLGMLLGRLEIYPVLILFMPSFWRA